MTEGVSKIFSVDGEERNELNTTNIEGLNPGHYVLINEAGDEMPFTVPVPAEAEH